MSLRLVGALVVAKLLALVTTVGLVLLGVDTLLVNLLLSQGVGVGLLEVGGAIHTVGFLLFLWWLT